MVVETLSDDRQSVEELRFVYASDEYGSILAEPLVLTQRNLTVAQHALAPDWRVRGAGEAQAVGRVKRNRKEIQKIGSFEPVSLFYKRGYQWSFNA